MLNTTIVSCYYLLPNNKKRSIPSYMTWISNFLRFCDTPIVMFSDGEIADSLDNLRKSISPIHAKNWILIRRPLEQLHFSSPKYMEYFTNLESKTPRGITADVVKLWMNKIFFLQEISTQNPFNTSSFLWCDAGCWRDERIASQYAPGWPRKHPSALTLTWINDSLRDVKKLKCPGSLEDCVKVYSPLILNKASIAGGIFGGSYDCIDSLVSVFPNVLQILMDAKIYVDGDQEILAFSALWLESQGIFVDFYDKFREPMPEGTDDWFLFQTIL